MRYLKYEDRCSIEALLKVHTPKAQIAHIIGCSERTVYNEIHRGQYMRLKSDLTSVLSYSADIAQKHFEARQTAKGAPIKLGKNYDMAKFCEEKILNGWSPDAVCGYIRLHKLWPDYVCTSTLYSYIRKGVFLHISEHDLLCKGKRHKKNKSPQHRVPARNVLNRRIDQRPDLSRRDTFGHWEMDTVIGRREKGPCLLVLTERKTRFELIFRMADKSAASVQAWLDKLCLHCDFSKLFKTITMDNGSEFINQAGVEQDDRTVAYYCHPYSSWERGSNENANRIVRRFYPKGMKIRGDQRKAAAAARWMNDLPRRILGYYTAAELFRAELLQIGVSPAAFGL